MELHFQSPMAALISYSASPRKLYNWWLSTLSDKLSQRRLEETFYQVKKFYSVTAGKAMGSVRFLMQAAFPQRAPCRLSKMPASEVLQAPILPLEIPNLKENWLFHLLWNKRLNKEVKEKLRVLLSGHGFIEPIHSAEIYSDFHARCRSCRPCIPTRHSIQAHVQV